MHVLQAVSNIHL